MLEQTVESPMSRKKSNPTATIKIDADLLRKAKQHTIMEDMILQDYFDALLRGPIERDHARTMKRLRSQPSEEEENE